MKQRNTLIYFAALVMGLALVAAALRPAAAARQPRANTVTKTVELTAALDNTLYQSETGAISNGQGEHLFAGTTNNSAVRRALVQFDLSAIPASATITSATLTLNMSKSVAGETNVTLHTVQQAWGEGESDAAGEEGAGAAAAPGDATWLHTFFNTATWTNAGGDFDMTPVATTPVGASGAYSWESAALLADVQAWVADPNANFGWLLMGDESSQGTAKRFDSRENAAENRPTLSITYEAEETLLYLPSILR